MSEPVKTITDVVSLNAARVALWVGMIGGIVVAARGFTPGFLVAAVSVGLTVGLERRSRDRTRPGQT